MLSHSHSRYLNSTTPCDPNPEFLSGIADFLKENLEAIKRLMFWMTLDTFGSMSHVDDCVNMGGKKGR